MMPIPYEIRILNTGATIRDFFLLLFHLLLLLLFSGYGFRTHPRLLNSSSFFLFFFSFKHYEHQSFFIVVLSALLSDSVGVSVYILKVLKDIFKLQNQAIKIWYLRVVFIMFKIKNSVDIKRFFSVFEFFFICFYCCCSSSICWSVFVFALSSFSALMPSISLYECIWLDARDIFQLMRIIWPLHGITNILFQNSVVVFLFSDSHFYSLNTWSDLWAWCRCCQPYALCALYLYVFVYFQIKTFAYCEYIDHFIALNQWTMCFGWFWKHRKINNELKALLRQLKRFSCSDHHL